MSSHNELGKWGEQKAEEHLRAKGYRIVECNWHCGHRDIDIVAFDNDTLVIVEVKTRSYNTIAAPEEAVDFNKIKSLSIAANAFVKYYRINAELRFDIISIVSHGNNNYDIKHIEDAFLPIPVKR